MFDFNKYQDKLILSAIFLFFMFAQLPAQAQDTYLFKEGLIANIPHRYGREALYTDELAYQLYTNALKTPADGSVFKNDDKGQPIAWKKIAADSLGRLRVGRGGGFGRGSSYIYLTYNAPAARAALLNIKGNSGVYVNGVPHMGDPYASGFLSIPIKLKRGLNEFYVRGGAIVANLNFPATPVFISTADSTLPHVVINRQTGKLQGAVVIMNTTNKELRGLILKTVLEGKEVTTELPAILAMSSRKVPFSFDATGIQQKGKFNCALTLTDKGRSLDIAAIPVEAVNAGEHYSSTFISGIDNSLQYFAVTPQSGVDTNNAALFLSVHGAGVEAIGQARAYKPKDWGTLVAATNRRPRGFNWEDWGRLDALEVLQIARDKFKPDPLKVYLTGHSMGGHGTWFLGATYPDKWAAIAPCSGYPTLKGYGSADGLVPDSSTNPMEQMLLRSSNQSDVVKLAENYKPLGVYILHGDSDKVVSVKYARQMKKVLADFHTDNSYYEYPGGEHWFGDQSVDWNPLFNFFKWHLRLPDSSVTRIDFTTASPGISASYRWASILQQQHPLQYSRITLERNKPGKAITGTTVNVKTLQFDFQEFNAGTTISVTLDGSATLKYTTEGTKPLLLNREGNTWTIASAIPAKTEKGPHRYGTFKDAFNHQVVFVYSTIGTPAENEWSLEKARYDAESWYYRGNGAVDIISDKEFSLAKYKDRGVILFGNKSSNAAWKLLLNDCPIQVERNKITAGNKTWNGGDHSAIFVWPIRGSEVASVGVVGGSGLNGMKAAFGNQYFAGASGFADFMIYDLKMLQSGASGVNLAGFFDNNWKLVEQEMITQ
ncbi:MAG: alpha/beta hydrolase-fold protein [Ferruginibacter sp.]|nr:alpha/beta hydrolase-fold protein [Ferruginibacter sp.]